VILILTVNVISAKKMMLIICLLSIVILCGLALLNHDKYIRYQMLDVGTYKASTWIYERIHFDDTPIDIAFFGTSHTMNGIDSIIVENTINQHSVNNKHVVNFAIPHFGRDMHYTLIKLLLESRKPELIILEVREEEARDLHPGTHYLADVGDLFSAPLIVNFRYFGNLIRQPLRQIRALSYQYFPEFFGENYQFSLSSYKGPHLNHALIWPDGKIRDGIVKAAIIDKVAIQTATSSFPNRGNIQKLKHHLEHRANLQYINSISELARAKGVKLLFTYLPSYGTAEQPADNVAFQRLAPMIKPDISILRDKTLWSDIGHLNAKGARQVSQNIAMQLCCEK